MNNSDVPFADPRGLGFRMPAEWEPHRATWLSWPHNLETWPDEMEVVEGIMGKAVAAIAEGEDVFINVVDEDQIRRIQARLQGSVDLGRLQFFRIPTNDAWVRDHGPIFVARGAGDSAEVAATIWRFNSWGGKYPPWDLDDLAAERMAEAAGYPALDGRIVLEGGSIDTNGAGALLTTEACLLNPNREREWTREQTAEYLQRFLGATKVIWLSDGIRGDDTDGHIDDISRFVAEDVVVTVTEEDPADENYQTLAENLRRLEREVLADGRSLGIVRLPSPRPLFVKGERMPASYANFYICNRAVLVPVFEDPADEPALATIADLFPGRKVVGLDSRDVIWGLGSIHCLTQQVPFGLPAKLNPESWA